MMPQRLIAGLIFGVLSYRAFADDPTATCSGCIAASGAWKLELNLKKHTFGASCIATASNCATALTKLADTVVCVDTDSSGECANLGAMGATVALSENTAIPYGAVWDEPCSGTDHWGTDCATCQEIKDASQNTLCKWYKGAGCASNTATDGTEIADCNSAATGCTACTGTDQMSYAIDIELGSTPQWTSSCRPCSAHVAATGVTKCVAAAGDCTQLDTAMKALVGDTWATVTTTAANLADPLCYASAAKTDCEKCMEKQDSAGQTCVSLAAASKTDTQVLCVETTDTFGAEYVATEGCEPPPATKCSKCTGSTTLKEVVDLTTLTVTQFQCVATGDCTASSADPKAYTRCFPSTDSACAITPTVDDLDPTSSDQSSAINLNDAAATCFNFEGSLRCDQCIASGACSAYKTDKGTICLPSGADYPVDNGNTALDECPTLTIAKCTECSTNGGVFVAKTLPNYDTVLGTCETECTIDATANPDAVAFCAQTAEQCSSLTTTVYGSANSPATDVPLGHYFLDASSCFAHSRQASCAACTQDRADCAWSSGKKLCFPKLADDTAGKVVLSDGNSPSPATDCKADKETGADCTLCGSNAFMVEVRADSQTAVAGCVPACPAEAETTTFARELGIAVCVGDSDCDKPEKFSTVSPYLATQPTATEVLKSGDLALVDDACWGKLCPECRAVPTPAPSGGGAQKKTDETTDTQCVYLNVNTPTPQPTDGSKRLVKETTLDQVYLQQGCVPTAWWKDNKTKLQDKYVVVAPDADCPPPPTSKPNSAHGLTVLSTVAVTALAALLL